MNDLDLDPDLDLRTFHYDAPILPQIYTYFGLVGVVLAGCVFLLTILTGDLPCMIP